jgi:hypothetical protein
MSAALNAGEKNGPEIGLSYFWEPTGIRHDERVNALTIQ